VDGYGNSNWPTPADLKAGCCLHKLPGQPHFRSDGARHSVFGRQTVPNGGAGALFGRIFSGDLEGRALSWPCPPRGGPRFVVAVFSVLADATAARPSIRLEPLPIAILKTYKGHALSWPCALRYRTRRSASLQNTLPATRRTWRATLCRGRVLRLEGHALSWPCSRC
jgi:hypothetical protein